MDIYKEILKLFNEIDKSEMVRSIGIRLGYLSSVKSDKISIFWFQNINY